MNLLSNLLTRNLIFVHGKGGVGKTVVSKAIALGLAKKAKKTLWITLSDPNFPQGKLTNTQDHLWHLNIDFTLAFEEYIGMKIGIPRLAEVFLKNKTMRYLSKVAPGIQELVLLGKIWFERSHYQHVVIDLPSTGYGLAMFQSTENFMNLFRVGPLYQDAVLMMKTFGDPILTGHLIVSLPEEMPLRESLELNDFLHKLFSENKAVFLANRLFPEVKLGQSEEDPMPQKWVNPLALTAEEYAYKRYSLEKYNLRLWRDAGILFEELTFLVPTLLESQSSVSEHLSDYMRSRAFL